jgi:hypothetical protein
MRLPNVAHDVRDKERNVVYRFMAYRRLSPFELRRLARVFLSQQSRKPKCNTTVAIYTSIK